MYRPLHAQVPRRAEASYDFYVELQSFSNPSNQDHDGGCCDFNCGTCDNYFVLCLRQAGFNEGSNSCPYGTHSTAANPVSGSSLQFNTGHDALAPNIPNPARYGGAVWPVSLKAHVQKCEMRKLSVEN